MWFSSSVVSGSLRCILPTERQTLLRLVGQLLTLSEAPQGDHRVSSSGKLLSKGGKCQVLWSIRMKLTIRRTSPETASGKLQGSVTLTIDSGRMAHLETIYLTE
jgi:hypothetical protein